MIKLNKLKGKDMSFIVIEGDNGTGKDTLALNIQEKFGYQVITNEDYMKALIRQAKQHKGKDKIKYFLQYEEISSNIIKNKNSNIVMVRYWISTLAAAYADNICSYEEICKLENDICSKFYKPDIIICLWCDFETRIKRIERRASKDFDDITRERNKRYKWVLNQYEIKTKSKWINIDTTNKNEEEVLEEFSKYVV